MAVPRRTPRIVIIVGVFLAFWLLLRWTSSSSSGPRPIKAGAPHFVESSFDWSKAKIFHSPGKIKPLPTARPKTQRKVQAPASAFAHHSAETETRREAVRAAFQRSWQAYRKYAWLRDEVEPVTRGARDTFGGWAATLVDSLDTLWIMDLKADFREAVTAAVAIDWAVTDQTALNIFETTIRHLGGLLSAYDLSGDGTLLDKAHELGEMLYAGFDTPNRLPGFWLNFEQARTGKLVAGTSDAAASPASLSIEMTRLSQLTGDPKFYDAADRVTQFLERTQNDTKLPGMWPMTINFREETTPDYRFTLGALADSLYEYLPKMHALLGGVDERYKDMYETAMAVVVDKMLFRPMTPDARDILFTGDFHAGGERELIHESQHLTCFVGGMFGLGGRLFDNDKHVEIGTKLARGCGWAYSQFPSGIMPEIFNLLPCAHMDLCLWDESLWGKHGDENLPRGFVNARDARYILRPEAIESLFVMYRITGKKEFQDTAWDMFQAIMRVTKTEIANTAVSDVRERSGGRKMDSMESFWTAETLKYFYLIFSPPNVISLDEYVFNTEAHPMRRPGTQIKNPA